jgi:hypothetical protein
MCFSAPASIIAGIATSGVGASAIKNRKQNREIPLASIPLLFGLQQLIEGGVWMSFSFPVLNQVLTYIYIFYSHIWWPFFVPLAIFLVEDHKIRRKALFFMMVIGICIGVYFTIFTLTGPVASNIVSNSIVYVCNYYNIEIVLGFYMLATIICCLISSHKMIKVFGIAILFSSFIAYNFYLYSFTSVWCFFSAALSLIILLHFKQDFKVVDYLQEMFDKFKSNFIPVK